MASSPDRASYHSACSRRRNGGIVIQKCRKFSVKQRLPPNTPKPAGFPASMDLAAVKTLIFVISKYISRLLADSNRRRAVRLKCKSRLRTRERGEFLEFGEQVVLANLYWGIERLEKAINAGSLEAKSSHLENAERMLQVPALIDEDASTAGISNSYISCCAYFHLALVWKLRRNDWQMALHFLQAFVVSPHYSRLDFASRLWKEIFLPRMDKLESKPGIQPDELHLKKSKLAHGQKDHEVESLQICYNEATRGHAKYYKDCLTYYSVVYRGDDAGESLWMDDRIHTRALNRESHLEKKIGRKEVNYHNQVDLQEGLYDAQPLNQKSLESSMEYAKNNDAYEGIHIGVASLPELSAEQNFASNEGKNASGKLHIANNKNEYRGSNSPLIEVEYCNASTRRCGTVGHLMSKEKTDPKRLLEMLTEPQSDMSMSADSDSNSSEEEMNTEKKTDKGSKSKAAACLSVKNMLTTDYPKCTGLQFHSGRVSNDKKDQRANYERACSTTAANNICSPLNQKIPKSIEEVTSEVYKKNSVLQDQPSCEKVKSCDDKYVDQPTVAHLTRQLLDPYKLEKLDSFLEITRSLPDFRKQLSSNETTPFCTRDTCFDDHLTESLRLSDIAKVKQFGNSARRKLDFSDHIIVYQPGNLNLHDDCQGFKREIEFEEAIYILCTSDEIKKCEEAILVIKYLWADLENKPEAESALLRSAVVDQLMEILLASRVENVLRAAICILSALVIRDKFIVHNILKADPELYFVTAILKKKKIYEAVILLYLLEPSAEQMKMLELLPILVEVLYNGNHYIEEPISLPWTPRAIAVMMIEILVTSFDFLTNDSHFKTIISLKILPGLLDILKSDNMEERVAATSVLTLCMQSDGTCRHFIAQRTPITSIVQLLHGDKIRCRSVSLEFVTELICLPRNSSIISILRQIQQHGILSSMHILMAYIQHVSLEYQPLAAGLLLQLDMLDESQGQSIFREEAVDVLLAALSCENLINAQISSASVLANLGGRFTYTGEPSTVIWLLKKAGLTSCKQKYVTGDSDYLDHNIQEEDNDAAFWSSKMAKKIVQSGAPVFEALKRGLKSKVSEVARDCLVTVAWLGYELCAMQRNCLRPIARDIILQELVAYMQPGIELEERVLASLSLYNYAVGSGMQQLLTFSKELHGPLRRLAALTWTAEELSKVIAYSSPSKFNTAWEHKQVIEINTMNGATLALIQYKGKLYSGHSDGSIKVWDVKLMPSHLMQEVRKHGKAVTCFALFEPSEYLISGSVDKTVRIWNGLQRILECIIVVNIKDPIYKVDTHGQMLFVVTKSLGVKVHQGDGITKVLNKNKHVQSLVVADDKIYCGCKDSSIQEIDVVSSQIKQIHGCSRTWLGKKPVYAIVPFRDWIYTAGALVEGFSLKVWRRQDGTLFSMASTGSDVQAMAVTEDFIYLKCSSSPSTIQIWMREKLQKVTSWSVGSRITSFLAFNDVIFCGTANGMIKAWIPN